MAHDFEHVEQSGLQRRILANGWLNGLNCFAPLVCFPPRLYFCDPLFSRGICREPVFSQCRILSEHRISNFIVIRHGKLPVRLTGNGWL
jgi:hypothetical protein